MILHIWFFPASRLLSTDWDIWEGGLYSHAHTLVSLPWTGVQGLGRTDRSLLARGPVEFEKETSGWRSSIVHENYPSLFQKNLCRIFLSFHVIGCTLIEHEDLDRLCMPQKSPGTDTAGVHQLCIPYPYGQFDRHQVLNNYFNYCKVSMQLWQYFDHYYSTPMNSINGKFGIITVVCCFCHIHPSS